MRSEYESRREFGYSRKRKNKKKALIRGISVFSVVVILVLVALAFSGKSGSKKNGKDIGDLAQIEKTTVTTIADVTEAFEPASETTCVQTETVLFTEAVALENDPEFEDIIARAGYSADELAFEQLITVDAYGTSAVVNSFEKIGGVWVKSEVLNESQGYVGTQGVSENASEYASYTPKGLFSLGTAFGICENPGTAMDYFQVTQESYWVDDVNSAYYNQHVEGVQNKDWTSAEHLIDYAGYYDYCVFIEYNTNPVVQGKGSAFFMHVGESPTAGCVAVSESDMISTLKWLEKSKSPHILVF